MRRLETRLSDLEEHAGDGAPPTVGPSGSADHGPWDEWDREMRRHLPHHLRTDEFVSVASSTPGVDEGTIETIERILRQAHAVHPQALREWFTRCEAAIDRQEGSPLDVPAPPDLEPTPGSLPNGQDTPRRAYGWKVTSLTCGRVADKLRGYASNCDPSDPNAAAAWRWATRCAVAATVDYCHRTLPT